MASIRKSYFTLDELIGGWGLPEADLRYVAENGLLHLSVRVIGLFMEFGYYEETDHGPMSVPCEHRYHDGLLDLYRRDVFALFRDGVVEPRYFEQPEGYACLLRDEDVLVVRPRDLLVRADERTRFEASELPRLRLEAKESAEFSDFRHNGRRYRFTPTQARVLRFLHEAHLAGVPWQSGKAVLAASGSSSLKLGDLFKRRPAWRELIEADGRGFYRLTAVLAGRCAP